jgi:hypothetical protein
MLMVISAGLQLSLVSSREWASLFGKVDRLQRRVSRSLSFSVNRDDEMNRRVFTRSKSATPLATQGFLEEEEDNHNNTFELKKQQ